MKAHFDIPHVAKVDVPRPHVMTVTFEDGIVRTFEFRTAFAKGPMFEELDDPTFFEQVKVDPQSKTVVWPNGLDLDPSVLHGDFEAAGQDPFVDVSESEDQEKASK
ncbi:MAG: DUF2442 domain-containing protein [Actinomycetota bacterium]|nr:DUF2442 domain-containing protein [Actinomycetota bacterium]